MGEVKARLEVIINYISTFSLVPRNSGSGDYQLSAPFLWCLEKTGHSTKLIIFEGGEAEFRGEIKPLLTFFITCPLLSNAIPQNENTLLHISEWFLKVELTARRTLSFLSGGDLVPLLGDILYPSEKELLAERQVL